MIFANYDKWRYHPIFRFTGPKDLKHLFPGFGTAVCLFVVYLGYKAIQPAHHHDHHEEEHHVIVKGASHAREILENGHGHEHGHKDEKSHH